MLNIRIAPSDIFRYRLECECKTATTLHLHQFEGGVLEPSERAMSSDIEGDLNMRTHCVKFALRSASSSFRGCGSNDKKSNSRRTRDFRPSRAALLLLVVCDAIRVHAVIENEWPTSIIRMMYNKPSTAALSGVPAIGINPATAWTIGETSSMTSAAWEKSRDPGESVVGGLG